MKRFLSLLLVALLFTLTACSESTPTKVGTLTTDNKTDSDNPAIFQVGEIAMLNNLKATLVGITQNNGSDYNKPGEGNVFVLCEFLIENNSDEELSISSLLCFEAYCDDFACEYSISALLTEENKAQLDGSVAPGKKMSGVIGYELPADWQELEIHFTPDLISGNEFVFVATNT